MSGAGKLRANYPMALDGSKGEVIAIFRRPPRLARFQMHSGRSLTGTDVCADADDVLEEEEFTDLRETLITAFERQYGEGCTDGLLHFFVCFSDTDDEIRRLRER